jgi:hypothetical protein
MLFLQMEFNNPRDTIEREREKYLQLPIETQNNKSWGKEIGLVINKAVNV